MLFLSLSLLSSLSFTRLWKRSAVWLSRAAGSFKCGDANVRDAALTQIVAFVSILSLFVFCLSFVFFDFLRVSSVCLSQRGNARQIARHNPGQRLPPFSSSPFCSLFLFSLLKECSGAGRWVDVQSKDNERQ